MTTSNRQTALVTGASAGIGKATVKALLEAGYTVYAAARRVENMRDLEDLGSVVLKMDVTNEEDLVAGVERINSEQGGVDILVNNAGFGLYGPMEDIPLDDARYQFEVNLFGLARLTQLVLPHMREQEAGKIVNVSSIAGKMHAPLGSWYIATKHALEGWSDCLRFELKSFGVDVIIIEPGLIHTEFGHGRLRAHGRAFGKLPLFRRRQQDDGRDGQLRGRFDAVGHRRHGPQGGPRQATQDPLRCRTVRQGRTPPAQTRQRPDV